MDFGFTKKQERLRKEVHDFYINELPEDFEAEARAITKEVESFWTELQKKAGEKGYLTPGWPKEIGGLGLGPIEQAIVRHEEWAYAGLVPNVIGLAQAGPAVHLFGTEEQKRKFLPGIARGEVIWFQAFTEPDAGSDEANVQLRAVPDGDDFILNGQKTFISGGYKPDFLFTLVRTADTVPKHRGLSLFLFPADLPRITFRPQPTMGGGKQNEIFFDEVRVAKEYLLGELNRGFYHAMATFEFERSGTGGGGNPATARQTLEEFAHFCREEKRNGKPLMADPKIREALAQMAVELEVWRLMAWHTVWWFSEREKLGPKPYDLTGFFTKIFTLRHTEMMMNVLGSYGQLKQGSKWVKLAGQIERQWQKTRSLHAGGTVEIYKVVLAQRGLELPRPPRPETKSDEQR